MSEVSRTDTHGNPAAGRSVRFSIEAQRERRSVFFEPEGAEIVVVPGNRLTVEISGGIPPTEIELTIHPEGLSVWAWAGADTAVWDGSGAPLDV